MQTIKETDNYGNQIAIRNPRLKSLLGETAQGNEANSQPIADLFPNCTVLFADIAGFTAWSSAREPTQVFMLLQSVYQAFDKIAARRKVFKVETIGDSCKFVQTHCVHPFPLFEFLTLYYMLLSC
jgi:class 3 adenylate cyclase